MLYYKPKYFPELVPGNFRAQLLRASRLRITELQRALVARERHKQTTTGAGRWTRTERAQRARHREVRREPCLRIRRVGQRRAAAAQAGRGERSEGGRARRGGYKPSGGTGSAEIERAGLGRRPAEASPRGRRKPERGPRRGQRQSIANRQPARAARGRRSDDAAAAKGNGRARATFPFLSLSLSLSLAFRDSVVCLVDQIIEAVRGRNNGPSRAILVQISGDLVD